jgi:hypothetical protein
MRLNLHFRKCLFLILIIFIVLACNKKKQQNSSPPPSTTSTTTWTTQLVGDWILRKSLSYYAGFTIVDYTNYYSPSTCHLNLLSSVATGTTYNGVFGVFCSPTNTVWSSSSSLYINVGAPTPNDWTIWFLSNDSMVLYSPDYSKTFIFNKTGIACTMSPRELSMVKNWTVMDVDYLDATGTPTATLPLGNSTQNYLDLKNTWDPTGLAGWSCLTSNNPFPSSIKTWKMFGNDSLKLDGTFYKVDTLTASKLVITNISSAFLRYRLQ